MSFVRPSQRRATQTNKDVLAGYPTFPDGISNLRFIPVRTRRVDMAEICTVSY